MGQAGPPPRRTPYSSSGAFLPGPTVERRATTWRGSDGNSPIKWRQRPATRDTPGLGLDKLCPGSSENSPRLPALLEVAAPACTPWHSRRAGEGRAAARPGPPPIAAALSAPQFCSLDIGTTPHLSRRRKPKPSAGEARPGAGRRKRNPPGPSAARPDEQKTQTR